MLVFKWAMSCQFCFTNLDSSLMFKIYTFIQTLCKSTDMLWSFISTLLKLGWSISRTFHFPRECGIEFEFPAGNAGNAGNTRYVLNEGKNTWKTFWTTFQSVSQVEWSISRIFMWILNSVLIKSFLRIIWVPDLVQKTSFWIIQFEI